MVCFLNCQVLAKLGQSLFKQCGCLCVCEWVCVSVPCDHLLQLLHLCFAELWPVRVQQLHCKRPTCSANKNHLNKKANKQLNYLLMLLDDIIIYLISFFINIIFLRKIVLPSPSVRTSTSSLPDEEKLKPERKKLQIADRWIENRQRRWRGAKPSSITVSSEGGQDGCSNQLLHWRLHHSLAVDKPWRLRKTAAELVVPPCRTLGASAQRNATLHSSLWKCPRASRHHTCNEDWGVKTLDVLRDAATGWRPRWTGVVSVNRGGGL